MDTNYNEDTQRQKVLAGMKGGPMFANPVTLPERNFVDQPSEVSQKQMDGGITKNPVLDPWVVRRSNSTMK